MANQKIDDWPLLLVGPQVRRLDAQQLVLWLVTTQPPVGRAEVHCEGEPVARFDLTDCCQSVRVGEHAWINLISMELVQALPVDQRFGYDLWLQQGEEEYNLAQLMPDLLYDGEERPTVVRRPRLDYLLHGSCRKPHYPSKDALARADDVLADTLDTPEQRPALLMLTGDQIYADDVAGPMLNVIHQLIEALGLVDEHWQGGSLSNSADLHGNTDFYYRRAELLPRDKDNRKLLEAFFTGVRKPIFTDASARNHLVSLAEILAMYVLVWSPLAWSKLSLEAPAIDDEFAQDYQREREALDEFVETLPAVQRALAHLPTYMIFDDHDVTDDWNLTQAWEEAAYGHPFARRIIGNAIIGYLLCQGWGNAPQRMAPLFDEAVPECFANGVSIEQRDQAHNTLIDRLLQWEHWHYCLDTEPKLVVLDTRTHRWPSEKRPSRPSGLLDWEALSELQQELMNHDSVVMVSAAPVYGVKLIETVQRVFTYFGQALMVDAENWMAHRGAANIMLNIFRHRKTPGHFMILSGDVHYSFVYDVVLRRRKHKPVITQITCSGLKNEFPHSLLPGFDRLNRWLYGRKSPLNWLTKRRRMSIRTRLPQGQNGRALVNCSALGQLWLDEQGAAREVSILCADGSTVTFAPTSD
ncbi:alkaline phosphatase family protein [Saccharospirillum sp. MSK14-1]|uniref:alkaline phosphatase family protein n=1 Tax=Saccharospirillum sp. MSK14-1 TaxID=1897632 RepID=UPI001E3D9DD9|nr:alkaline phosphatase family protein [Saccharospirillum sp. MSK14-1]